MDGSKAVTFGPSLGQTVWGNVPVVNHAQVMCHDEPIGILFRLHYAATAEGHVAIPAHDLYRIDLIQALQDVSSIVCSDRSAIVDHLIALLS
jgi:hypothetical protein